jgi:quinol monooxygenase YgiN
MSVIVLVRIQVDPANLEKVWADRVADFKAIEERARAAGALHHRWGLGEDHAVLIDEWETAEAFHGFFDDPTIASLMQEAGVQGPPEFDILRAAAGAPDEF